MSKKFILRVGEVWTQEYQVDAENLEEALHMVHSGKGDIVDNTLEFSHMMDRINTDVVYREDV